MPNLQSLLPFLLIAVLIIPMVLMSRKQKKAMQQQQELQSSLSVGDRVMTTSGLYATVTDVSDSATIELEIAPGVETSWLRAAVREKVGPDVEDDEELTDSAEDTAADDTAEQADALAKDGDSTEKADAEPKATADAQGKQSS
jgi:preprotein translocase subunit YajC